MEIIGAKVHLAIDEPWDEDLKINGRIIRSFIIDEEFYYVIEDELSRSKFIIPARYQGKLVPDILVGKTVIVGVSVPKNQELSFEEPVTLADLSYRWIGTLKLIKD